MTGLEYIRRGIRSKPTFWEKAIRTVFAIAIPTGVRWLLVGQEPGAPFVLYFPAILMIAVLLGWRSAAVTALGSCIVAVFMFWPPEYILQLGRQQITILFMFALSAGTMIAIGQLLRNAVLEIETRARQSEDFNRELQHRTKNSIQMMRALASQASRATDPAEFYATLGGRLTALAKANELLRFGALEACEMHELMQAAVAPFNAQQIAYSGPSCRISRNGCTPLMMALHELGTNASKYGALSTEEGKVRIYWHLAEDDGAIRITWEEIGGPPVQEPARRGIGTRLLAPSGDMREVDVRYLPQGVVCELTVEPG